ncbi:MAG: hypothetical protein WCK77_11015 [Verrucomicrobiota bacterium]
MKLPIHAAVITHDEGSIQYVAVNRGDLIDRVADWCRAHWSAFSAEPPPPDASSLVFLYFCDNEDDSLELTATTIDLPGPYAAASELFAALQEIADTPKREESGPSDRQSGQRPESDIDADIDHGTTARLHALIDKARAAIALASIPSIPRFTVFCQEAGGSGTIHIDTHEAADLESAIITGKQRCIDDWSSGFKDGESPWNMDSVHCLGVAAGDVDILHWSDQPQ